MAPPDDGSTGPGTVNWNTDSPAVNPDGEWDEHVGSDTDVAADAETKGSDETMQTTEHGEEESDGKLTFPPLDASKTESHHESPELMDNIKSAVTSAKKKFHLHHISASGPSKIFNPTNVNMHVRFNHEYSNDDPPPPGSEAAKELALQWRSRDNRKGRGSIAVPNSAYPIPHPSRPMTLNLNHLVQGIVRMCTTLPYWDMAWWSGCSYSLGSILFVLDGAFSWGPLYRPSEEWPGEEKYVVPLLFFFGALLYQVGATMAYLEAVNDGSFAGSALRRFLEGHEDTKKEMLDEKIHGFFDHLVPHPGKHRDNEEAAKAEENVDPEAGWKTKSTRARPGSIYPGAKKPAPRRGGVDMGETEEKEEGDTTEYLTWRWWPTWQRLKTHHIYEIGYIACSIQLLGATLYGITGVVVLPGILNSLSQWQENVAYWIPQIVASVCFLSAALLFMFETQEKWYKPKYKDLGWWIGFWAAVGSMGFL